VQHGSPDEDTSAARVPRHRDDGAAIDTAERIHRAVPEARRGTFASAGCAR